MKSQSLPLGPGGETSHVVACGYCVDTVATWAKDLPDGWSRSRTLTIACQRCARTLAQYEREILALPGGRNPIPPETTGTDRNRPENAPGSNLSQGDAAATEPSSPALIVQPAPAAQAADPEESVPVEGAKIPQLSDTVDRLLEQMQTERQDDQEGPF